MARRGSHADQGGAGRPRPRRYFPIARLAATTIVGLLLALGAGPAAQAQPPASTPELISGAVARGEIGSARGDVLRAYALRRPDRLPPAFRSRVPWDGTPVLQDLQRRVRTMPRGRAREEIEETVGTIAAAGDCGGNGAALPSAVSSAHYHVEYGAIGGGLDVADYVASLETAWSTQVGSFGWAAPPVGSTPAPGSRYHVRIENLGSGLYGFVSTGGTYAGFVGDNPATTWNEGDAYASCMVLNSDYTDFGDPQVALDATTAHELNHSIVDGYGAYFGAGGEVPLNFSEGGATWMEDEVFDAANDNYNYLWPRFDDGMGAYGGDEYGYWITFRGLTERFGTGVAGGGEDVMQRFWELLSRNGGSPLTALDQSLAAEGTTLGQAFHDYGAAVKFLEPCGGAFTLPLCFEEAAAYPAPGSATANAATIAAVGGSTGTIGLENRYAIKWVGLPASSGPYAVRLASTAAAGGVGRLRGSVVCDTGTALVVHPLPAVVADGGDGAITYDPAGCAARVLVVTNETATSGTRGFTVSTGAPVFHQLAVTKAGDGAGTVTSAPAGIACGTTCTTSLAAGTVVTLTPAPAAGSAFAGWSGDCSGTGACQVTMTQARNVGATFSAAPPDGEEPPPGDEEPPPGDEEPPPGDGTQPPPGDPAPTGTATPTPSTDPGTAPTVPAAVTADRTAPAMGLSPRRPRADRRGRVRVRLSCPATEPAGCRVQLTGRTTGRGRSAVAFRSRAISLTAGQTRSVRVRLTRAVRRTLSRGRRVQLRVTLVAADAAGNVVRTRHRVTVRRR